MYLMGAAASQEHSPVPSDNFTADDTYVSFLPSAHSYEQWLFFCFILAGGSIGFYSGDPRRILEDDLPYLRPTFWPSVPRLVNLLYAQVKAQIDTAEGEWGKLMRKGLQEKLENIKKDGSHLHNIYDPLVFSTVKARAGGRLRMLMSGAAPTAKEVQELLKVSFCCSYPEAYGMTETAGGSI